MPKYIVSSEGPISVRAIGRPGQGLPWPERPTDPGWGVDEGEGGVAPPWIGGGRPGQGLPWEPPDITIPPREEWPPLPPFLQPGPGFPIPPSPEHPMVPIEPEITDPPEIWPPIRNEWPDLSGKTLILARFYVSRHVNFLRWVLIDHQSVKDKIQKVKDHIKDRLPAGGVGGTPPQRPGGAPR